VNDKDFLKHYGILGMHWGRRKGATIIHTPNSDDHNKRIALKGKKLREMSNEEIQTYTKRMALEKQYKELSKNDISFGKKLMNDIINGATKTARDTAMNYVNKQAAKMVEEILKKATTKAAT